MSVATDGIHCLCPPRLPAHLDVDGRPLPKIFAEHRIEVFEALSTRLPFAHWQTGRDDDIGTMILEWLATVLDNLSFYADLWTRQQHLTTANEDDALRQLAALTGVELRPNLAAIARIAVIADAAAPFVLPAGRAVTSEGTSAHPALDFETMADAPIDPALNEMTAIAPREATFDEDFVAIDTGFRNLRVDEPILFRSGSTRRAVILEEVVNDKFPNGEPYAELKVDGTLTALDGVSLAAISVQSFANQTDARSGANRSLEMPGVQTVFHEGQHVAAVDGASGTLRFGEIKEIEYANELKVKSAKTPVLAPCTRIKLDCEVTKERPHTVFHGLRRGGRLVGAPKTHMTLSEFGGRIDVVEPYRGDALDHKGDFVVVDDEKRSVAITAGLDVNPHNRRTALTLSSVDDPGLVLKAPLKIHGNFAIADQGRTVTEPLGSADGRRFQTFRLGKKPLTFVRRDNADPAPAIEIFVDGAPWRYVPHLHGVGPGHRVFTLRVEPDGQAHVILGGIAKPGVRNVVSRYRFGTTGDNPDAFTIKTPDGRIPGVGKLFNPFPALAGLKGDAAQDLPFVLDERLSANDRCVSATDYAVLSRDFGALAALARPSWNARRKRAAIEVTAVFGGGYDPALADKLRDYLVGHAPEGIIVDVVSARPAPLTVGLTLRLTPEASTDAVERQVRTIFFHEHTGVLALRRARIGHGWSRSELLAPLDAIDGVLRVERLSLDGDESRAAVALAPDEYLDAKLDLELLR